MKIVFMGTPDYAVKTLEKIIEAGHTVAAVFAQPDKPVGRKRVLTAPPVKVCALEQGIPVYQPDTLRDGKAKEVLDEIAPDAIVVVAYGKLLPEEILNLPKYGCINGHASLLPKYRGASPIQWCIVCGETETGVTTMFMDKGMDTGDILETERVKIGENETAEQLFERLSLISAELMVSTLAKLQSGEITPQKQNHDEATYAPIIKKEMALLDFNKTANELSCAVRGYYSWPCAFFFLNGKRIKVISAKADDRRYKDNGGIFTADNRLFVSCQDGSLEILELQPEGSKPMTARQFLNGNQITEGMAVDNNG